MHKNRKGEIYMAVPVGPIIKLAGEVVKAGVTTKVIEKVEKIVLKK